MHQTVEYAGTLENTLEHSAHADVSDYYYFKYNSVIFSESAELCKNDHYNPVLEYFCNPKESPVCTCTQPPFLTPA